MTGTPIATAWRTRRAAIMRRVDNWIDNGSSGRDALAKVIGDAFDADESDYFGGGYVDSSSLGSTVLDGRSDLRAVADAVIAAGWRAHSVEGDAIVPLTPK